MKDVMGNEIKIGDKVAYIEKGYLNLKIGYIAKICNVMTYINDNLIDTQLGGRRHSNQIIKIKE